MQFKYKFIFAVIFLFVVISCKKQAKPKKPPEKYKNFSYKTEKNLKSIYIAGNFNSWKVNDPDFKMKKSNGKYKLKVNYKKLKNGKNLYVFVVNGEWIPDPKAEKTEYRGIGGKVSVFHINQPRSSK